MVNMGQALTTLGTEKKTAPFLMDGTGQTPIFGMGKILESYTWTNHVSGQIIATSHDLTPKGR